MAVHHIGSTKKKETVQAPALTCGKRQPAVLSPSSSPHCKTVGLGCGMAEWG